MELSIGGKADLSLEGQKELVARVAASKTFQKSAKQREIFLYLCERALTGNHGIREQEIGTAVCGRAPDYDTSQDNIVRVHVSELRRRLEKYFEEDGAEERCLIEIPRGGYAPVFRLRQAVEVPLVQKVSATPWLLRWQVAYGICALFALCTVWLVVRSEAFAKPDPRRGLNRLWSRLLVPGQATDIVLADSNLSLLQDLTGQSVSLNEYLNHQFWRPATAAPWSADRKREYEMLMARRYTSISDADFVGRVKAVAIPAAAQVSVFFSRDYALQELQANNVVLVGSFRSNPWAELYQNRLDFQFEVAPETGLPRYRIRNLQPGEREVYSLSEAKDTEQDAYGAIAFLPGANKTRSVLLISGTGIQAIRAGAEFVMSGERINAVKTLRDAAALPYFELLFRTKRVGGAARDFEVIATRTR